MVQEKTMRERLRQPTLNAVKAFEAAARLGSLKAAAEALGVTSSAVSHQVRQLEEEIGKQLFIRRNNAIELTGESYLLFEQVAPALRTIARATEVIRTDTKAVALNVTNGFALLWLIPRLPDFQKRQPRIAVEMDTVRRPVVLDDRWNWPSPVPATRLRSRAPSSS
jgi:LysR family glycine cleavage system transcriptional activator